MTTNVRTEASLVQCYSMYGDLLSQNKARIVNEPRLKKLLMSYSPMFSHQGVAIYYKKQISVCV